MRYSGMPMGMWALFAGSFRRHLSSVYGYDPETARSITYKAKARYKEIIQRIPEFERSDRFKMNAAATRRASQSAESARLCESWGFSTSFPPCAASTIR